MFEGRRSYQVVKSILFGTSSSKYTKRFTTTTNVFFEEDYDVCEIDLFGFACSSAEPGSDKPG
jgi:hypothetical protein